MAGAGYKLFNTGDVLTAAQVNTYLQEQVVMVFADAAARTTALSGVLAEGMVSYLKSTDAMELYNGSAWVGIAADQTPLTTKGDLFTYSTADARLAVGNNGETLVADSSATVGLRYSGGVGFFNPFINSAYDIWQRGTSISLAASTAAASGYNADRWQTYTNANQAVTISRQATGDTTNLPAIQYCLRYQRNSGQTGTGTLPLAHSIESSNSIPFAGKTVTLSFYARKGANYSATSDALAVYLAQGTGTDQNIIGAGLTSQSNLISSSATLTTTWQRFTFTGSVNAASTQLALQLNFVPTGTAGAADYFEITGVQLDVGSTALPFRRTGGNIAGELQAAQRYYQILGNGASAQPIGCGSYYTTTDVYCDIPLKVTMRTAPTLTFSGGATGASVYVAGNVRTSTATATQTAQTDITQIKITTAADTAGRVGNCFINANATLAFSSEL